MVKGLSLDQKAWTKKHGKKITKEFLGMGSITNLKENKSIFIPCDCHNEFLVIEYDHKLKLADLCIYQNTVSYKKRMSLWQRLVYCWLVLVHKKPYADQIQLGNHQLKDIKHFINGLDL